MNSLTLIGTDHKDLDGYARLMKLFNHYKPDVIGLETTEEEYNISLRKLEKLSTPEGFEEEINMYEHFTPEANPETLRQFILALCYDVEAARDYSQQGDVKIIPCDSEEERERFVSDLEVSGLFDIINEEFKEFIILSPDQARANIRMEYAKSFSFIKGDYIPSLDRRDGFVERILRQQEGNVVYVCGQGHINGNYYNLSKRLNDLHPTIITLDEADKI